MEKSLTLFLTFAFCCMLTYSFGFSNPPIKIISLTPSLTETIYSLDAADCLIGYTTYCRKPENLPPKEIVASAVQVNVEKVVNLNPDIIMASPLTNAKTIEKLRQLGMTVKIFPSPRNFTEICGQFLEISKLLNKSALAETIIENTREKVTFLKNKVKNMPKPKVFFQIGAKPLFTVTQNSFINDFIEFAGGINIAKNLKGNGRFSREKVLEANPDCIIIADMGIIGEEEKKAWQNFKNLNAAENKRIYIIAAEKICSPTPQIFADTLEEITNIIHPELKNVK